MKKLRNIRKETFSDAPQWYKNKKRARYERRKREVAAEIAFLRKINY